MQLSMSYKSVRIGATVFMGGVLMSIENKRSTIANPSPLGLLGLGMTTILLNLHNAGIIDCLTFNIPFQQKAPTRRSLSI
jgi:succinate-acetate transporter protein